MPLFTRAEMNEHITKTGKRIAGKENHSVPTNLLRAKTFLDNEYLEDIQCIDDEKYFYFKAKCCHSYSKNLPPHTLKLALCIISGEIKLSTCSCTAGTVGFCNHILGLMFKVCKFSLYGCEFTTDLEHEDDQQAKTSATSLLQKWHKKGGGANIAPEPVLEVVVKKVKMDSDTSRPGCVKPLLYEARANPVHSNVDERSLKEHFHNINSNCGFAHMHLDGETNKETVDTKFGKFKVGSCLSHQVSFTEANFKAVADIESIPRAMIAADVAVYPPFTWESSNSMPVPDYLSETETTRYTLSK